MQNIGKVVRAATGRAAAVGAATSAAAVAHPAAHARVQTAQPRRDSDDIQKIQDDWVIPELNRDIVIFKPEEIDNAAEDVQALLAGSAHRHEVESDTSEGTLADSIIELADSTRLPAPSTPNRGMDLVFRMANRLLQQPGMQQVVLHTMINDPEIRDILVSQDEELERFLQQGGIIPGGLLTEGDGSSRAGEIQMQPLGSHAAGPDSEDGEEEAGFLQNLMMAAGQGIGATIEGAGDKLSSLGRWIRAKIGNVVPEAKDPDTGKPADGEGPFAGKRMDTLMGAVVTVAVAIMAVCLVKRPQALGGLLRKLFARA